MLTLCTVLAVLVCAALLAGCANWLELWRWRASVGMHWTERARRLFPARVAAFLNLMLVAAIVVAYARLVEPAVAWQWTAAGAVVGALLAYYPIQRAVYPEITFVAWVRESVGHLFVRSAILIPLGLAAALMPANYSWRTWAVAVGYLAWHLGLQLGFGIKLLKALRLLQPGSDRLVRIVTETSAAMNVPVRNIWELKSRMANAFAFFMAGGVAFTTKLMAVASDDDLRAICAHELGHLAEPRGVVMARVAGTLSLLPAIFIRPALVHFGPAGSLVLAAAMFLIVFSRVGLTRRMETRADRVAHAATADPAMFARALERMHLANQMPAVIRKRKTGTHPELYDRMLAAGVTPDYPRPKPPPSIAWSTLIVFAGFMASAVVKKLVWG